MPQPVEHLRDPRRLGTGFRREAHGEQGAGRHLGVEGLRRGHAHLHVAAVGRVDDAVGLLDQVAVSPVHDGDDDGAARTDQVDGAVRVGRRPRLAHGHDSGVGHVVVQLEPGQLGGGQGGDGDGRGLEGGGEERRHRLARNRGGALADHDDPPDAPGTDALDEDRRHGVGAEGDRKEPVPLVDAAPQRLAERTGGLVELLEQVVRELAPVDVARRDRGTREVGFSDR